MGKLSGKKLILLGERDGVASPAWRPVLLVAELKWFFQPLHALSETAAGAMDLQNQQRILDAAQKYGAENVVVLLGSADADGAGLYAETVTAGDPTYAGPLAGVPLGLPCTMCSMKSSKQKPIRVLGKNRSA